MMRNPTRIALLAAALAAVPAAAAHAQEAQPAPAAPAQGEADQLRQRIGQLQQQAMEDPSLMLAKDTFDAVVEAAMARLDPQAAAKVARARSLNQDVEAARAAGDNARLNQLADEATALNAYFAALRPRALAEADVQEARRAYLARVLERMKEIDPDTQQYVDRLAELQRGAASQSGGGGR